MDEDEAVALHGIDRGLDLGGLRVAIGFHDENRGRERKGEGSDEDDGDPESSAHDSPGVSECGMSREGVREKAEVYAESRSPARPFYGWWEDVLGWTIRV